MKLVSLLFEANKAEKMGVEHLRKRDAFINTLNKYIGNQNAFLHYSKMRGKLGINVRTGYSEPIGVYGFPLGNVSQIGNGILIQDYLMDIVGSKSFSGSPMAYVFGFKDPSKVLWFSQSIPNQQFKQIIDRLGELFGKESVSSASRFAVTAAYAQSSGVNLYKLVAALVRRVFHSPPAINKKTGKQLTMADVEAIENPKEKDIIENELNNGGLILDDENNIKRFGRPENFGPAKITKTFVELGFHGVVDDTNQGFIHGSEPSQAIAFSSAFIDVYEQLENPTNQEKIVTNEEPPVPELANYDFYEDGYGQQKTIEHQEYTNASPNNFSDNLIKKLRSAYPPNKKITKFFWKVMSGEYRLINGIKVTNLDNKMANMLLSEKNEDDVMMFLSLIAPSNEALYAPAFEKQSVSIFVTKVINGLISDSGQSIDVKTELYLAVPKIVSNLNVGLLGQSILKQVNEQFANGVIGAPTVSAVYRRGLLTPGKDVFVEGLKALQNKLILYQTYQTRKGNVARLKYIQNVFKDYLN